VVSHRVIPSPSPPANHENARSALECGSGAAALEAERKAVAGATALQGAFGTCIFRGEESPRLGQLPTAGILRFAQNDRRGPQNDSDRAQNH